MSNEKKSKFSKWINFAIGSLTIILKVIAEIVELIPNEEQGA